jgi:hypothetical protein
MARRHWFNSVGIARIAIAATMLFGPIGRYLALATMGTLRGWSMQPAKFWRPFTVVSLVLAASAALFWPYLEPGLYEEISGEMTALGSGYLIVGYIVWSLVLVPHNIVRILQLIQERRNPVADEQGPVDKPNEMRSDDAK